MKKVLISFLSLSIVLTCSLSAQACGEKKSDSQASLTGLISPAFAENEPYDEEDGRGIDIPDTIAKCAVCGTPPNCDGACSSGKTCKLTATNCCCK